MKLSKEDAIKMQMALLEASLSVHNLRPHVGDSQLQAAENIREQLHIINEVLMKGLDND
jgi:hypothetical protein